MKQALPRSIAIAEAALDTFGLSAEPGRDIAGVQEPDPDTGVIGRSQERPTHLVRIGVRAAIGLMVEVVEFTDGRDAASTHLGVHALRQREVAIGGELGCARVHLVAPRPEAAAFGLGSGSQRPMERVRVAVGHPRNRQASLGLPSDSVLDGRDHTVVHGERDVIEHLAIDVGVLQANGRHGPTPRALADQPRASLDRFSCIGTRTPRSAATCVASS